MQMSSTMADFRSLQIAVTGAGGFIGSALTAQLAARGASIRALQGPPGLPLASPQEGVQYSQAEIDDPSAVSTLLAGCAVVVHVAGTPYVADSFQDPAECVRVHVVGTANVIAACRRLGTPRLVYVSSAEVYGQPSSNPVDEDSPASPRSPYGIAKRAAEQLVECCTLTTDLTAASVRPFSIYGPGMPSRGLLPTLVRRAQLQSTVEVTDLRPVRDYCYIDDLVELLVSLAVVPLPNRYRVFNAGSGRGISVEQIANAVFAELPQDVALRQSSGADRPRECEIHELVSNPARAQQEIGWRAHTSLGEGMAKTVSEILRQSSRFACTSTNARA